METGTNTNEIVRLLRVRLLDLARRQDDLAANVAAATPYWKPQPATVHGYRTAADALRAEAELLIGRAS